MSCRCRLLRAYYGTTPLVRSTKHRKFASNAVASSSKDEPIKAIRGTTKSPFAFNPLPSNDGDCDETDYTLGGKFAHRDDWTNYVEYHHFRKREQQRKDADPYKDPDYALKEWEHFRSCPETKGKMSNVSVLQWALIASAGCERHVPDLLENFAREFVDAYKNSPDVQGTMVSKVLHRLLYPDGVRIPLHQHPALIHLTKAWTPSVTVEQRLSRNVDDLVISIYKEYYGSRPEMVQKLRRSLTFPLLLAAIRTNNMDMIFKGPLLNMLLSQLKDDKVAITSLAFPSLSPNTTVIGPPGELFPFYGLVQQFLNSGSEKQAFQLFQRLIQTGFISPKAISKIKLNSGELKDILLFALVRSCLDYEWITGALELLINAARAPRVTRIARSPEMRSAINETIFMIQKHASLMYLGPTFAFAKQNKASSITRRIAPGASYLLQRCLDLVSALRTTDTDFMLDNNVVHELYRLAYDLDAGPQAQWLYDIGRFKTGTRSISFVEEAPFVTSPTIIRSANSQLSLSEPIYYHGSADDAPELPKYPTPEGRALTWFMNHLIKHSQNVHLARTLATEVADNNVDIPMLDRGSFLCLVANHGYALSAKKIWMRYSEKLEDGVVGHAASMVRLVSLFANLAQRQDLVKDSKVHPGEEQFELTSLKESKAAAMEFAESVISKYRESKEPLIDTAHQDLNALARAYFMVGKITTGFDVLQIVMDKKEMPDLRDVNVALSGMAKYSPRLAGKMIDRMIGKGFLPDSITFGTVIKEAISRGDSELIVGLVRRAKEVGDGSLSFKTVAALVRASVADAEVSAEGTAESAEDERREISLQVGPNGREGQLILGGADDLERIEANLKAAWEMLQVLPEQDTANIPNLGENCVRGAIKIGQPELGYKFWDLTLRNKTQWDDIEQLALRRQLATLVQRTRDAGKLEETKAKVMLRGLNAAHMGIW